MSQEECFGPYSPGGGKGVLKNVENNSRPSSVNNAGGSLAILGTCQSCDSHVLRCRQHALLSAPYILFELRFW